jgi:anti-anti-sigma regulatory factor
LRLKHVHDVDATTALGIKQLKDYLQKGNRQLIVCNIPEPVMKLLRNARLVEYLGEDNLIPHDESAPQASLKRAVERAHSFYSDLRESNL